MKMLEIEKTKPTFIISTFKTDIIKEGLVFSISNIFIAKTSLANNWRSFSSSYLALHRRRRNLKEEICTPCKDFYLNEPIRLFCSISCDKNKIDKRPVFLS